MTVKQSRAINNLVENGGNVSRAMREAGYSPKTAKNPRKLTDSRAWTEKLGDYLSEEFLLDALHTDIASKVGNRKSELELGFKLTDKLNPKLSEITMDTPVVFNVTRGISATPPKPKGQTNGH